MERKLSPAFGKLASSLRILCLKINLASNVIFWVGMGWGIGHLAQRDPNTPKIDLSGDTLYNFFDPHPPGIFNGVFWIFLEQSIFLAEDMFKN